MKVKNVLKKFFDLVTTPFISLAIWIDESRRENADGSWNKYHARRNKRAELKELRRSYRAARKSVKEKWASYGG